MREHMGIGATENKITKEENIMENKYFIVRGDRSGVFFGKIAKREGREVTMTNVRRLWQWHGATECCQLAAEGVKSPNDCKFTITVREIVVLDAVEMHPCTEAAAASIGGVQAWKM